MWKIRTRSPVLRLAKLNLIHQSALCVHKLSGKPGRWDEAPELTFHQPRKFNRRSILELRPDDLYADGQARVGEPDRRRGGRKARDRRHAAPNAQCVHPRTLLSINLNDARFARRMIVRPSRNRMNRTNHDVHPTEQLTPLLLHLPSRAVRTEPLAVTEDGAP